MSISRLIQSLGKLLAIALLTILGGLVCGTCGYIASLLWPVVCSIAVEILTAGLHGVGEVWHGVCAVCAMVWHGVCAVGNGIWKADNRIGEISTIARWGVHLGMSLGFVMALSAIGAPWSYFKEDGKYTVWWTGMVVLEVVCWFIILLMTTSVFATGEVSYAVLPYLVDCVVLLIGVPFTLQDRSDAK